MGTGVTEVLDQAKRRRNWKARDEFGRLWESTLDFISQGTCAPINPKGWNDPLGTPQKYLIKALSKDPDTDQLGIRIIPALEQWSRDLEKAHEEYEQRLYNDALMLFGTEGPKAYEDRAPALLNYTGPAPQPFEPVLAALAGDQWALGLSPDDPNNIQRFFPKKETKAQAFLRSLKQKDELDERMDLEEQHDPKATGGKKEPVRRNREVAA